MDPGILLNNEFATNFHRFGSLLTKCKYSYLAGVKSNTLGESSELVSSVHEVDVMIVPFSNTVDSWSYSFKDDDIVVETDMMLIVPVLHLPKPTKVGDKIVEVVSGTKWRVMGASPKNTKGVHVLHIREVG